MIEFNSLELVSVKEPEKLNHILMSKRYVLGSDPFLQTAGSNFNVFTVYDKATMSFILKLKTKKKSFDDFIEWVTKKREDDSGFNKREYIVSRKFITDAGTAVRISRTDNF